MGIQGQNAAGEAPVPVGGQPDAQKLGGEIEQDRCEFGNFYLVLLAPPHNIMAGIVYHSFRGEIIVCLFVRNFQYIFRPWRLKKRSVHRNIPRILLEDSLSPLFAGISLDP